MDLKCLILLGFFALASAEVQQCPGKSIDNLNGMVDIPCKKSPCRLKKGTNQHITINFTPEKDLKDVKNHVTADVLGVPLPFIGVDGNSICSKITDESGNKASCPLKAGEKYIYKDSFPVHSFYPSIDVKVHWALQDGNKDLICFELPARIS